jgi:predicted permease
LREDLRERFAALADEDGLARARRWYLRQVLSAARPATLWALRVRDGSPGSRRARARWIGDAIQDVGHALRRTRKAPGAAIAAVLMLGIGVGGGTGVYAIHRAIQDLTGAGLPHPDRIRVAAVRDSTGRWRTELPARAAARLLEAAPAGRASLVSIRRRLVRVGGAVQLRAVAAVTPEHFAVTGAPVALGRGIGAEDVGTPVVVVSYDLWRDRLGGDPGTLGAVVHLDRRPYTVVGVAAEAFRDLGFVSAWTPLDVRADAGAEDGASTPAASTPPVTLVVGPVRERDPALAGFASRIGAILDQDAGAAGRASQAGIISIDELTSTDERRSIQAVFGILGALSLLVLVAASANVANLGTAQVLARRRELALRRSLGASRGRVVRLVVTELLCLGLFAGVGAAAVVAGLTRLIPLWLPPSTANVVEFRVEIGHLWIALALSVLATLLSAAVPALRTPATADVLRGEPGSSRGQGPGRLQRGLVVLQVATSALLLASAGLLVRSTTILRSLDQGLSPGHGSVFTVAFPDPLFGRDDVEAFLRNTLSDLGTLPGVDAAAAAAPTPVISGVGTRVGRGVDEAGVAARRVSVSEGYFQAVGTELVAGRGLRRASPDEVVVTADLAERLWPGGAPLGHPVVIDGRTARIVGVTEAGVYGTGSVQPHVFLPLGADRVHTLAVVIRGSSGPGALLPEVRSAVREQDPDIPVNSLGTLGDLLDRAQVLRRAASGLAALLGSLAFVIAVVGLYAHFSHHVASQRRAVGIRLALGAPRRRVLREALQRGLALTAVGLVVGGALTLAAGRILQSLLFGVTPADPGVLGSVTVFLVLTAAGAVLVPARSAAAVEPMEVLRED